MDITEILTQFLQYIIGVMPGDIASDVIAIVTTIVTVCTLVIRFWKEPTSTSGISYNLWKAFHLLASFKKAVPINKKE